MPKRFSTKNVQVLQQPTSHETGRAIFDFTDDYSVFHYSKMPDQIPGKGEALCRMASHSLSLVSKAGVATHFLDSLPPKAFECKFVRIIDPAEVALTPRDHARLIPLQVICRNMLPEGSSVARRLQSGLVSLEALGLAALPEPGETLQTPIIEFTTKLEEIDRFITHDEAQKLAGLDARQFAQVKAMALAINRVIADHAQSVGLTLADGKVEFALDDDGDVMLVDTAGTLDENRFLLGNRHVTKQVLRDFYLKRGLEADVQRWARAGRPRDLWPTPERLPAAMIAAMSDLYRAMAERWTGERIWNAPSLEDAMIAVDAAAAEPAAAAPPKPRAIVVVGTQFGDEGKGKYTDILARSAAAVVRYQAGTHTGHTVVLGNQTFKLVQVPTSAMRGSLGVLGNGCVVAPGELLDEIETLDSQTPHPVNLRISERAHVIFPHHIAQDQAMERWRAAGRTGHSGTGKIGSTQRGVGPCREDKVSRAGLRMVDLLDLDLLRNRLASTLKLKRALIENGMGIAVSSLPGYDASNWDPEELAERFHGFGLALKDRIVDTSVLVQDLRAAGGQIIFEGAQSTGLDLDHGSYPFCSSGASGATGVPSGSGLPPEDMDVYGVMKCYTSRVGGGPLLTELDGDIADHIVMRGREYGTVTGRRRRVGWLDLPLIQRAIALDGISKVCLGCLDVLAGLDEVRIATGYKLDGRYHDTWPAGIAELSRSEPNYVTLHGWPEQNWSDVVKDGFSSLSQNARCYVQFIAQQLQVEIVAVGLGPSRDDTLWLDHTGMVKAA